MHHYVRLVRSSLTAWLMLVVTAGTVCAGPPLDVTAPPSTAMNKASVAQACSDQANARGLHGIAGEMFRTECERRFGIYMACSDQANRAECKALVAQACSDQANARVLFDRERFRTECERRFGIFIACSDQANARGLHGIARQRFRTECKKNFESAATLGTPSAGDGGAISSSRIRVPLKKEGGTFVLPVQINGAITLDFTVDSGAADVSVPADVFSTLRRTGTIKVSDIIGEQTYVLADGSKAQSFTFTIRSLKVGNKVVENVTGSVASARGPLLLGQSFLERFKSWSIDNTKRVLLLEPQ